ncbi:hypothetical protein [Nocardioides sp. BYT-33-1]|uniref:hypothetical protein n=1 Tax=Nocardioides sp. BYT-33-1 TaxID=3416952 RepID=UPI003F53C6D2
MANPEMWKLATRTNCGPRQVACRNARPIEPEEMYEDPADAGQLSAGEEDQSEPGWEAV